MRFTLLLAALSLPLLAQSPGIPGVVAPGVEPELVKDGFMFTEGPVGTPDGGLYFTDIAPRRFTKSILRARSLLFA